MGADHETLGAQLQAYERELGGLKSYVRELKDKTAEHGTESEHFGPDLMEAENNIKYYEAEIALLKGMIGDEGEGPSYFVYRDAAGEWHWQLRAANRRIIADSGQGYSNRQDCLHGINLVKDSKKAPVKEGDK